MSLSQSPEVVGLCQGRLASRARALFDKIKPILSEILPKHITKIYIAGNSMNGVAGDVDVYLAQSATEELPNTVPMTTRDFLDQLALRFTVDSKLPDAMKLSKAKIVFRSPNAITYTDDSGTLVQVCKYTKPTLEELIASFDYAHIQIGAEITFDGRNSPFIIEPSVRVAVTDNWVASRIEKDSWFCGSEYPFSSLVRLNKYAARGDLSKHQQVQSTIRILAAMLRRGFSSWKDFKDQLDAVDLGLLPEDLEGTHDDLILIYEKLKRNS